MAAGKQAKGNLIVKFGPFWARNEENFRKLRVEAKGLSGIYLLYCGWFPVYVGCGHLVTRIPSHRGSRSKVWDRFTWFAVAEKSHCRELEAIFLKSLPFYLRLNNKQGAHLYVRSTRTTHRITEQIKLPKMLPSKHRRRK
jgi:hypothetical protein